MWLEQKRLETRWEGGQGLDPGRPEDQVESLGFILR